MIFSHDPPIHLSCLVSISIFSPFQSDIRTSLVRIAHSIGLNIEGKLAAMIDANPEEVYEFVRIRYEDSAAGYVTGLHPLPNRRHTIAMTAKIRGETFSVHIDYVFGDFLINGTPMGRLPENITKHATFQRIFGNMTFEVYPSHHALCTKLTFDGFNYIFRESAEHGIIVIERDHSRPDRSKELIPHTKMSNLVPFSLVNKFSHWYDSKQNVIEFRPKSFGETNFATVDGIQYELDVQSGQLTHTKTQRFLLDVRSESFQKIANLLVRLEHSDYIVVMMDAPSIARVELVRMNLNFIIDCSRKQRDIDCPREQRDYDIESIEYSDMRVCRKQNIGTLFGLRFGLVLESTNELITNQLLIVPHGKPIVHRRKHHVAIKMNANHTELRTPSFFIYHVNAECRALKANSFAAWFYLAHLHAITSYPLPDPFTGTYIRYF